MACPIAVKHGYLVCKKIGFHTLEEFSTNTKTPGDNVPSACWLVAHSEHATWEIGFPQAPTNPKREIIFVLLRLTRRQAEAGQYADHKQKVVY